MLAAMVRKFGGIEDIALEKVPDPAAGPGQVVIEVAGAGVNFPDLLVTRGLYQILPPLPFTPGKEAAGVVAAVGEGVATCKPGDRVIALIEYGSYCERLLAPAANCFVMPDSMQMVEAAGFALAYQTAHFALLDRARLRPGEYVLVTGAAGGVGLACVRLAKALGARVIAAVSTPEKGNLAIQAGAESLVDTSGENLRDSIRDQVRARTANHGADVVLEVVGGDVFDGALRALAWRGRLVTLGFAGGRIPKLSLNAVLLKNIEISGLHWSDYREWHPDWMRRAQEHLFRLYEEGKLPATIDRTMPLAQVVDAMALLQDRKVMGKVVLTMGETAQREQSNT